MTGRLDRVESFSVEADVPGGPQAAARARRLIESQLSGRVPLELLDDVALLTTELIANGVRHGGGGRDAVLHLLLRGGRPGLRVEVENADRRRVAIALRKPDMGGGGGIGLHLVAELASRWGVRSLPRPAVWFEIDC
jgi:anti-sigma regulatory factor (Ser/Thr protein kinase)